MHGQSWTFPPWSLAIYPGSFPRFRLLSDTPDPPVPRHKLFMDSELFKAKQEMFHKGDYGVDVR